MVRTEAAVRVPKVAEEAVIHLHRHLHRLRQQYAALLLPIRAVAAHRLHPHPHLHREDREARVVEVEDKYINNQGFINYIFFTCVPYIIKT